MGRLLRCARNDSCDLGRPFHLRVEEVLVLQFDSAGRAGDGLVGMGRENLVLLQHAEADMIEMSP